MQTDSGRFTNDYVGKGGGSTCSVKAGSSPLLLDAHAWREVARRARAKPRVLLELPPLANTLTHSGHVVDGGANVQREDGVAVLVVGEVIIVDDICAVRARVRQNTAMG